MRGLGMTEGATSKRIFDELRKVRDEWLREDEVYVVPGAAIELLAGNGLVKTREPSFHSRTGLAPADGGKACTVLSQVLFGSGDKLKRVNRRIVEALGAKPCTRCFPRAIPRQQADESDA